MSVLFVIDIFLCPCLFEIIEVPPKNNGFCGSLCNSERKQTMYSQVLPQMPIKQVSLVTQFSHNKLCQTIKEVFAFKFFLNTFWLVVF
jgi:hypothetical protein